LNISGSVLSTVVPGVALTNVGFAFSDYAQVWSGLDGALGTNLREQIDKSGFVSVAKAADNGFRQITSSSRPIKSAADLQGYRIRVPVSPIFTSLFKALGATPTSINFNELYTALQTKLVDGQENGLVAIEAGKLYEVQKFVAQTNHIWDPFWLLGNRRAFGALPDNLKDIVRQEFDRASMEQRADVERLTAALKDQLGGKGLTFENTDRAGFRAALAKAGFYKEWKEKFGADNWAALESVVGQLS
jgi:tripartite ATP-independent transporter DctP family solute receptor